MTSPALDTAVPPAPGRVRFALAQIDPALGDLAENERRHVERIVAARDAAADAIIFPELSLAGYYLRDIVPDVALAPSAPLLGRLATAAGDAALAVGFVEAGEGDRYYNSAAWFEGAGPPRIHRKVYLPTYGMFDEGRYFAAGHRFRAFDSARLGRVGLLICEDLWHVSAAAIYQADEVDWLVCLANSPARGVGGDEVETAQFYRQVARTYAVLLGAGVVVVNRAGVEEGLCFWGGSLVVGPDGAVLGQARPFDPDLLIVDVDVAEFRRARLRTPLGRDARLEVARGEFERLQRERYRDES